MRALLARLFRRPAGGRILEPRPRVDDSVLVLLSPGSQITDPDEAEALGMNVGAKWMRHGRGNTNIRCDCCNYQPTED